MIHEELSGKRIGARDRLDLALLINFKNARLEWKRVLRPQECDERSNPTLHSVPSMLSVSSVVSHALFMVVRG